MEIRDYEYILIPNILEKFKCSMSGECCQNKWRIDIDEKSYLETKKKVENQKENIDSYIASDNNMYVTKFNKGYCKFITEDKKCRVHSEFGWECLSDTCKIYPRNLKLTSRGMEIGMGFSCRSSAKLLLSKEKFEIKKIKKEDYFFMNPHSVTFIIPENNSKNELTSKYYEIEELAIGILNSEGELWRKVYYLEKVLVELKKIDIENYDFKNTIEEFKTYKEISKENEKVEDELVKIILEKKKRSESVGIYYINLLREINLKKELEKDKEILANSFFKLDKSELETLKKLWKKEDDRILQNYIMCNIFNKELYYNQELFMMKIVVLSALLKFRVILNKAYLGRELTEKEMIYTIKSHDEDLAHDIEFFSVLYKKLKEEKIDISNLTKKMISILS